MARPSLATVGAFASSIAVVLWVLPAAGQDPASAPPPQVVIVRPTTGPSSPAEEAYLVRTVPVEPPPPRDPQSSFTFSVGWASLNSSGGDTILDEVDGYYFDTDFSYRLKPDSPLWLGISFNGSYFHEEDDQEVTGGVIPTEVEVDAALSTFCIEPRLTFLLLPRRDRGPYVAGKLGAGLLIADYWASRIVERPGGFGVDTEGDTTFAFEVRPGVQVGYTGGPWALGVEAYEMWAWGDFNELGDQLNELRIGFFFTLRH
jgi:hypothetical protein